MFLEGVGSISNLFWGGSQSELSAYAGTNIVRTLRHQALFFLLEVRFSSILLPRDVHDEMRWKLKPRLHPILYDVVGASSISFVQVQPMLHRLSFGDRILVVSGSDHRLCLRVDRWTGLPQSISW